jgi:hypothetical protein
MSYVMMNEYFVDNPSNNIKLNVPVYYDNEDSSNASTWCAHHNILIRDVVIFICAKYDAPDVNPNFIFVL